MQPEINTLAVRAADDPDARTELIALQESFILRAASVASHRYVSKSDDEWSVALLAFSTAIDQYAGDRGDFLPFARLVITSRLTDYFRKQKKYGSEVTVPTAILDGALDEDYPDEALQLAILRQVSVPEEHTAAEEIEAVNEVLAAYGFSFFDLTSCSPKHGRTKTACAKAISCLLGLPMACQEMRQTRQLPIKLIEKSAGVPRKILERHRSYIIAATEILMGSYPALAEYLAFVREGGEQ